jgi:hypothetical protein
LQQLTDQGRQKIDEIARRYSVSTDAVMTLLQALVNSNGTMAQFNHWELGGGGQWMRGGMTMVGDMFNYGLKSKVDGLCSELSQLLAQQPFVPHPSAHAQAANFRSAVVFGSSLHDRLAPRLGYDSRAERRAKFRCNEWRTRRVRLAALRWCRRFSPTAGSLSRFG